MTHSMRGWKRDAAAQRGGRRTAPDDSADDGTALLSLLRGDPDYQARHRVGIAALPLQKRWQGGAHRYPVSPTTGQSQAVNARRLHS